MSEVFGRFHGHVVLVTGAARGIGLASAQLFKRAGATVVAADIRDSGVESLLGTAIDDTSDFHQVDVADPDRAQQLVRDIVDQHGRLDVVHGNAGLNVPGRIHTLSTENYRTVMGVCLDANFFLTRAAVPHMRAAGGGVFVFTSSMCGIQATPRSPAYNMAKHALTGLVQSIAIDYGGQGIRAVAVVTGPTATPMIDELWGERGALRDGLVDTTATGRMADPAEQARAVVFAALPDSGYLTGSCLTVDGGATAGWMSLRSAMFGTTASTEPELRS